MRPCIECGVLCTDTRCTGCKRLQNRIVSAIGRQKRGPRWKQFSVAIRRSWRDAGFGCVDVQDGKCKGRIQADHVSARGPYLPRCAYHNNRKH